MNACTAQDIVVTSPDKDGLIHLIESRKAHDVSLLQQLVRIPTPNPPGETRHAIEHVKQFLAELGIESFIIAPKPESPNLVSIFHGRLPGSTRRIILNGHIDQFPVSDADKWQRDPYSGDIENGYLFGRSGVDMKAGTTASILAFVYLHANRAHLSGSCVLEVVSDEETGGRWGTRYLIEDLQDAASRTNGPHEDVTKDHDFRGDVVLIGEPSGLQSIRCGEKGTLRFTVHVATPGYHGAYTHRGKGAIRVAAELIDRLVALEHILDETQASTTTFKTAALMDSKLMEYMNQPEPRRIADEIMNAGASDSVPRPTVNIGTIHGGTKINMIPCDCSFEVDIRVPVGMDAALFRAHVEAIINATNAPGVTATMTVHENHSHVPTRSPRDHELVSLVQLNAVLADGMAPVPISSLGATDCKHFRRNGVPAYAFGPSPDGMAERDEKVRIDEFFFLVLVHTLTAWDYMRAGMNKDE